MRRCSHSLWEKSRETLMFSSRERFVLSLVHVEIVIIAIIAARVDDDVLLECAKTCAFYILVCSSEREGEERTQERKLQSCSRIVTPERERVRLSPKRNSVTSTAVYSGIMLQCRLQTLGGYRSARVLRYCAAIPHLHETMFKFQQSSSISSPSFLCMSANSISAPFSPRSAVLVRDQDFILSLCNKVSTTSPHRQDLPGILTNTTSQIDQQISSCGRVVV